jgi:hypothetical protein
MRTELTDEQRDRLVRLIGAELISVAWTSDLGARAYRVGVNLHEVALFSSKSQMVHMFDLLFLHSMVSPELEVKRAIEVMALRIVTYRNLNETAKRLKSGVGEP